MGYFGIRTRLRRQNFVLGQWISPSFLSFRKTETKLVAVLSTQVRRILPFVIPTLSRDRADGIQEFEIGLEIDSAEIRAILLYEDQEWGR